MRIPDSYEANMIAEMHRQAEWDRRCNAGPHCSRCGSPVLAYDSYLEYEDIVLCEECVDKCTLATMDLEVE